MAQTAEQRAEQLLREEFFKKSGASVIGFFYGAKDGDLIDPDSQFLEDVINTGRFGDFEKGLKSGTEFAEEYKPNQK